MRFAISSVLSSATSSAFDRQAEIHQGLLRRCTAMPPRRLRFALRETAARESPLPASGRRRSTLSFLQPQLRDRLQQLALRLADVGGFDQRQEVAFLDAIADLLLDAPNRPGHAAGKMSHSRFVVARSRRWRRPLRRSAASLTIAISTPTFSTASADAN